MPTEKKATPIASVKHAKARKQLPGLCSEIRELSEEIACLTEAKKALMIDVKVLAISARITKVVGDGWQLIRTKGRAGSLSKEKLLAKGVTMETLEACTGPKSADSFSVRKLEEK